MQATVLLNANISFLTINDVDSGTGPRTPAQLASYVSTIASIAAVIVALLLIRQHRVSPKETATDAVRDTIAWRKIHSGIQHVRRSRICRVETTLSSA